MRVEDLKEGDEVVLADGRRCTINMVGEIKCQVFVDRWFSVPVYSHDIVALIPRGGWEVPIIHTPEQCKLAAQMGSLI